MLRESSHTVRRNRQAALRRGPRKTSWYIARAPRDASDARIRGGGARPIPASGGRPHVASDARRTLPRRLRARPVGRFRLQGHLAARVRRPGVGDDQCAGVDGPDVAAPAVRATYVRGCGPVARSACDPAFPAGPGCRQRAVSGHTGADCGGHCPAPALGPHLARRRELAAGGCLPSRAGVHGRAGLPRLRPPRW